MQLSGKRLQNVHQKLHLTHKMLFTQKSLSDSRAATPHKVSQVFPILLQSHAMLIDYHVFLTTQRQLLVLLLKNLKTKMFESTG